MSQTTCSIGDVVASKAGRDAGRAFVVVAVYDANYVALVDGVLRTVARPKKKKCKHLSLQDVPPMTITDALVDADYRKYLRAQGFAVNRKQ